MGRSIDVDDPLSAAIAPPPNESPEQRAERERREADERKISDAIDEQIRVERAALKKRKKPVKVLLLGQSESGQRLFPPLPTNTVTSLIQQFVPIPLLHRQINNSQKYAEHTLLKILYSFFHVFNTLSI